MTKIFAPNSPPEIHRPHHLLHREGSHPGVVGGERTVLERGVGEQVRGDHPSSGRRWLGHLDKAKGAFRQEVMRLAE